MPAGPTTTHTLLDSQDALRPLLEAIEQAPVLALDTEFVRESTYFARLCLLQVGIGDRIACIDPLAEIDLTGFWSLVLKASPITVMHAGRQDLELIYQHTGRLPERLFDTQVAAALLGYPAQIGYAGIVAELLGVPLDKGHARTDWARRPLADQQLSYAADDVRYLPEIYHMLAARLQATGRTSWAEEECRALLAPALYANPPALAWQRVKGINRLGGRALAIAQALAEWREATAERLNRPRKWILSDAQLICVAEAMPRSIEKLRGLRALPPAVVRKCGEALLEIVARTPASGAQHAAAGQPLTDEEKSLLATAQQITRQAAAELNVEVEVLATRAELTAAARGNRTIRLFSGWRRAVLGQQLLDRLG